MDECGGHAMSQRGTPPNTSHATFLLPPHPLQVFRGRDVALLYSQLKIFFPDVASESVGPAGMQPV